MHSSYFARFVVMYAVFEDGSRQYTVKEGDIVRVDFREADLGTALEFPRVLLVKKEAGTTLGQPLVAGAKVLGEVVTHTTVKTVTQKFRRRKNYRKLRGHTQPYTSVKINKIEG